MQTLLRRGLPLLLLSLLCSCGPADRQDLDFSDRVAERPADGIGHYIYALNLPQRVAPGGRLDVQMEWRTVGPVDPKSRYDMDLLLTGPARHEFTVKADANTVGELHLANWMNHYFTVPAELPPGRYVLGVRLRDARRDGAVVPLGYRDEFRIPNTEGYYRLAELEL